MLLLAALTTGSGSAWAEDAWVKTEPTALVTGDIVVIVDEAIAMALPTTVVSKNPSATAVTLNTEKTEITSDVTSMLTWTVTIGTYNDKTTYQFSTESNNVTYYLTCSNVNTGVAVSESGNTAYFYDSDFSKLKSTALSRWIGVYNSQDWRCYSTGNANNIKNTVTSFYKKIVLADPVLQSITLEGNYPTSFLKDAEFSHEGMTVTATYDRGGNKDVTESATFSGYDMSATGEQTVTVSYTENEVTKTVTYNITVNEPARFVVTYADDDSSVQEESVGSGVLLPARSDVAGYAFLGWCVANINEATTTQPSILTGTYYPAGDITLYPVYSYSAGINMPKWVEIKEVPDEGTYAICSNLYFMKASTVSNRFENGGVPSIKNGVLTEAPKDNCVWNLIKSGDYYLIKHGENYAASTGSNNQGKFLTDFTDTKAQWTIDYNEAFTITNAYMSSQEKNATLRNNSSYGWGTYAASTGEAPRLFKYTEGVELQTYYLSTPAIATISLNDLCADGAKYYGTYSSSSAFVVPADITVSEVTVSEDKLTLTNYETGEIVPAGTGVLVSSASAGNHVVTITIGGTSRLGSGNMLKPSGKDGIAAGDMSTDNTLFYRLTMHNGTKLGFWWGAVDGAAFRIAANKAYLAVPTAQAANIQGFVFDDETTGIASIEHATADSGHCYNLSGQRVNTPAKGLYIKNGKKFVVK